MIYNLAILLLLEVHLISSQSAIEPVQLKVYYETHCSDSLEFFREKLKPALGYFNKTLNVELIPYGKANASDNYIINLTRE